MELTFVVKMGFWLEGLVARCYKDHVSRRMLGRVGMTLWNLKMYRQIGSKTKGYRIQRRFLLQFIFFPDLGLQAACFLILSLRPYASRSFPSRRIPSRSSMNIHSSLGSQICSNNLNPPLLSPLLTPCQEARMATLEPTSFLLLNCCNRGDQTPGSRTCCVQRTVLSPPAWRFQKPKALCEATDLARI